jgi:GNAT superfamily N-acetyltransferase
VSIVVSPVEIDDLESAADLMVEMDEFYDEPHRESTDTKVANMREFLFGTQPSAFLLVARDEEDPTVLGLAAYSYLWPAVGTTRSLYLKELYVRRARRRDGVGRLLMDSLLRIAEQSGCSRVEWITDRGNGGAQQFYAAVHASMADGKLFYRAETTGRWPAG